MGREGRQGLEAKRAVRNDSPSWHFPSLPLPSPVPPGCCADTAGSGCQELPLGAGRGQQKGP